MHCKSIVYELLFHVKIRLSCMLNAYGTISQVVYRQIAITDLNKDVTACIISSGFWSQYIQELQHFSPVDIKLMVRNSSWVHRHDRYLPCLWIDKRTTLRPLKHHSVRRCSVDLVYLSKLISLNVSKFVIH